MAGKMEHSRTFKMDDTLSEWLGKQLLTLDCSVSDLIRASLLLSVPIIKQYPRLLRSIQLEDINSQ